MPLDHYRCCKRYYEDVSYHSPVGNSNVPYPYAVGENKTFLMLEKVGINNEHTPVTCDPYKIYYNAKNLFPVSRLKVDKIHPKMW